MMLLHIPCLKHTTRTILLTSRVHSSRFNIGLSSVEHFSSGSCSRQPLQTFNKCPNQPVGCEQPDCIKYHRKKMFVLCDEHHTLHEKRFRSDFSLEEKKLL